MTNFNLGMKSMKQVKLSIVLIALSLPVFAQEQQGEPPAALVEIESVNSEQIAEQIWVPGTVVSRTDSDIASEVSGRITWMAEVGDIVKGGEVLAKLDDHKLQLEQLQNQSNIAKWEASVALLERKQERFAKMAKQNNTSKDQLDQVLSDLEIAKQELSRARIDSKLTAYQLSQSQVKAPFTAMVVERLQTPGEYTGVGQDLLRIVDTANIEASIKAPLSAVPFIAQGMNVTVKSSYAEKSQVIRTIVPVGNAQSRMMEVRVKLDEGDFAIGSAVRVALPHSEYHQAMTVPRDALVLRKSGAFVYQVNKDNLAQQIDVKTGIGAGERIEVFGNLNINEPVVVRGAERLKAGQKVRFEDASTQIAKIN